MKLPRRKFLHLAAGAATLPVMLRIAWAQTYPSRPVRLIVPFPPGGGSDILARIMGRWLSERLGQPVIIENKPGGNTNVSVQTVVSSPPDGYTLLFLGSSAAINATFYETLPFNLLRDIAPVAGLSRSPMVLEVSPSVPVKSVAELIIYAKANPGKITMASYGTGSTSHMAGELLKMMTGVNMAHVPYRGGAPMVADLLAGHVQVGIDVVASSLPHIRSGALRPLAVATTTRLETLPDVPTVAETVPGYEALAWSGLGVPRGTPPDVIERLNREINAGLADPDIKARFAELTTVPMVLTPAEFGAYIAAETEKWAKVVKFAGIKAE
jgi:tripartite-type tricarboxylate transporter receptor subunit TctC